MARRAGIAASEARGTYEGLWLLDRAEEHAAANPDPATEHARNASIRAEMHLDAGDLATAETEARRAAALGRADPYLVRQARRTLVDVFVSRGDFGPAEVLADEVMTGARPEERWMALSAWVLRGRVALEQGQLHEGAAAARAVFEEARTLAEDRIALLAETLLRRSTRSVESRRRSTAVAAVGRPNTGCSSRTRVTTSAPVTLCWRPEWPPTSSSWPTAPARRARCRRCPAAPRARPRGQR